MKFNISIKRLICLVLAMLMLFSVVGCGEETVTVKKVIKRKPSTSAPIIDQNPSDVPPVDVPDDQPDDVIKVRPERDLPEVATKLEILDDPIVDEFDHEYKDYTFDAKTVIIYGYTKWADRYEGYVNYGTAAQAPRAVEYTAENRLVAKDIQTWIKDKYNLNVEVYLDTVYADKVAKGEFTGNEKKILVGDNLYHTSTLAENEFAVKLSGDTLIFDGGHYAMVETACDWWRSVETKENQVAVITGKHDGFKSQIEIDGVKYDYIWGDEFDGYEFNDDQKWAQSTFGLERQDDMANIFGDPKFQYVENGKVRLTGDRYYDEGNHIIGYATSGQIDTDSSALFRNGYFEFYARLPYRRGGFPAIWTMTADANVKNSVHNYNVNDGYGIYSHRLWDIEFDLFESFADADHMTTTIHKWYRVNDNGYLLYSKDPVLLTEEETKMVNEDMPYYKKLKMEYAQPLTNLKTDGSKYFPDAADDALIRFPISFKFEDGTTIDSFKYRLSPYTNMSGQMSTYAYSFSYDSAKGLGDKNGGKYDWRWYFNPETINNEYHLYSFHYTSDHCTVSMDGVPFLDFDWDPAYDYKDTDGDGIKDDISRNNNGVGYNLWHYFLVDMMIYTPNNFKIDTPRKIIPGDCPFHLYIDYVRFYQDLDDTSQAVAFNNETAVK